MTKIKSSYGANFKDPLIAVINFKDDVRDIVTCAFRNRTNRELNQMAGVVAIFRIKALKLLLPILMISGILFAHTPTQICKTGGVVSFKWSAIGSSTSVRITYAGYDTTISPASLTTFKSPLGINATVRFHFNDGYSVDLKITYDPCSLPIVLSYFRAQKSGDAVQFFWQTATERNSDYFSIQASKDGLTWQDVAYVKSKAYGGSSEIPIDYTAKLSASSQAGAGYIIGFICFMLFIGIMAIPNRTKNRINWIVLILFLSSCAKSYVAPETKTKTQYRLKHVDLDNSIYYSEIKSV